MQRHPTLDLPFTEDPPLDDDSPTRRIRPLLRRKQLERQLPDPSASRYVLVMNAKTRGES